MPICSQLILPDGRQMIKVFLLSVYFRVEPVNVVNVLFLGRWMGYAGSYSPS
uniref:Uncharacterized protein n=1 Tax=Arundo donax TaxID=35708 RepID=A0A0A9EFB7_ARUDO